jgi:hypothetical protein
MKAVEQVTRLVSGAAYLALPLRAIVVEAEFYDALADEVRAMELERQPVRADGVPLPREPKFGAQRLSVRGPWGEIRIDREPA